MRSPVSLSVGPAGHADLPVTAALHETGLPHGFFVRLGGRFLAAYHGTFVDGPLGVAIVARRGSEVVGVVVGSTRARAHSRWTVRQRGGHLALVGLWSLLTHPAALAEFVRTRLGRYLRGIWQRLRPRSSVVAAAGPATTASGRPPDVAVLRHVVVDPAARGAGVGAALVTAFVDEAHARGASTVRLVTRAGDGAGGLYDRLGWRCRRARRGPDGTVVLEYEMDLPTRGSGPP